MPVTLDFSISHRYDSRADGIEVPVTIRVGAQSVEFSAKLDTGAASCIIERRYGEMLGLNIEGGRLQRFRTAAGAFSAFEHEVDIEVFGIGFSALVYFAQEAAFPRSVLGRNGWLDRLRIGLIAYDGMLYLSPYDE